MRMKNNNPLQDLHYIPANHVFANRVISGPDGARKHVKEEAARMRAQTSTEVPQEMWNRWVDWYEKTAIALLDEMNAGGDVHQRYPPFVP